ncbi:MAG: hypothetical protein GY953_16035 [bacterium]|nr:hypothetical protein [bacterium]
MSEQRNTSRPNDERRFWLDDPNNVNKIFWALVALCATLLVIDLFLHRHTHYDWEAWPGFHGFFGFAAFWCIVIAGKHLRKVMMREEDYYDP